MKLQLTPVEVRLLKEILKRERHRIFCDAKMWTFVYERVHLLEYPHYKNASKNLKTITAIQERLNES